MAATLAGRGGRKRAAIVGINVTPMVDVVLVLLVILMVSSTYIVAQTLKVHLPKARATDGKAEKPVLVTLTREGELRLDERDVNEAELSAQLGAMLRDAPERNVVVSADRDVPHGMVVHVLDLAKLAGATRFAINVQAE